MKTFLKRFAGSDRGASMVEYGLMVALVAIIAVPAASMAGHKTEASFNTIAESLASEEVPGEEESTPGDDDDTPAPGDDDDTPAPGDDDDTPGPGDDDDDDTPAPGDDDDDTPAPGDDDDDTPAPGDDDDDTPAPGDDDDDTPAPGSEAVVSSTDASFTWWNDTKHGGEGAWRADVEFENDWTRHQYLTLEITRTDERGGTTTSTVNSFYVPANGKATYQLWDNGFEVKNGNGKGVVSVEVKVVSVTTADEDWQPITYPQGYGNSTVVNAPRP
jgi:Flp pilus assembly pilin Flp